MTDAPTRPRTPAQAPFVRPENIAATVQYKRHRLCRVTHPLGDDHPNAVATRARLIRQGFRILPTAFAPPVPPSSHPAPTLPQLEDTTP